VHTGLPILARIQGKTGRLQQGNRVLATKHQVEGEFSMKDNLSQPNETSHWMRRQVSAFMRIPAGGSAARAAPARKLVSLALLGIATAEVVAATSGFAQGRRVNSPAAILGRGHDGQITQITRNSLVVVLKDGGTQAVELSEIWRIRRAFASNEPPGTTIIDIANNRLFVPARLSDVIADVGRKVPLTKLTAPNGDDIYIAATKVTDITNALPELHNPQSKTVIGTRDGIQQVLEPPDTARRIIAEAHVAR